MENIFTLGRRTSPVRRVGRAKSALGNLSKRQAQEEIAKVQQEEAMLGDLAAQKEQQPVPTQEGTLFDTPQQVPSRGIPEVPEVPLAVKAADYATSVGNKFVDYADYIGRKGVVDPWNQFSTAASNAIGALSGEAPESAPTSGRLFENMESPRYKYLEKQGYGLNTPVNTQTDSSDPAVTVDPMPPIEGDPEVTERETVKLTPDITIQQDRNLARNIFEGGNREFNDQNIKPFMDNLERRGYLKDDDPRQVKRREEAQAIHERRVASNRRNEYESSLANLSPAMRAKMMVDYDKTIDDRNAELAKQSGVNETAIKKQKMITDAATEVRNAETAKEQIDANQKFANSVHKGFDDNVTTVAETLDDPEDKRLLSRHSNGFKRAYDRYFENMMKESGAEKANPDLYQRGMSLVYEYLSDMANEGNLGDNIKYSELMAEVLKDL